MPSASPTPEFRPQTFSVPTAPHQEASRYRNSFYSHRLDQASRLGNGCMIFGSAVFITGFALLNSPIDANKTARIFFALLIALGCICLSVGLLKNLQTRLESGQGRVSEATQLLP